MSSALQKLNTLRQYIKACALQRKLRTWRRETLEQYQQRQLKRFAGTILARSPYFKVCRDAPLSAWPRMDKKIMMEHFDRMNTAGLHQKALLQQALAAEESRDFSLLPGAYSVGLSSGTSGHRGLFVTSAAERALWSGSILAKCLPRGLFAGERIALFLRADNALYQNINNRFLSLVFFDLFANFEALCDRLQAYRPTIIVAPAQVLAALARKKQGQALDIEPHRVVSCAEVLSAADKTLLQKVFREVAEIYQATEGFLGATCEQGVMHLNEEYLYIEPQWLDEQRFTPVVTDFMRSTQPIVRYQLDDVLHATEAPCPCGRPTRSISHIEGRADDQLNLPRGHQQHVVVFADACNRAVTRALPANADYLLEHDSRHTRTGKHRIVLTAPVSMQHLQNAQKQLEALFRTQQADLDGIDWVLKSQAVARDYTIKRRRIVSAARAPALRGIGEKAS